LPDLIQQIEKFGIAADNDTVLERRTLRQWQEAQNLEAKVDRRELGSSHGRVMDGKTLKELYIERGAIEAKKKKRLQKSAKQPCKSSQPSPHPIRKQSGKHKAVSFVTICSSDGEASIRGEELGQWYSDGVAVRRVNTGEVRVVSGGGGDEPGGKKEESVLGVAQGGLESKEVREVLEELKSEKPIVLRIRLKRCRGLPRYPGKRKENEWENVLRKNLENGINGANKRVQCRFQAPPGTTAGRRRTQ